MSNPRTKNSIKNLFTSFTQQMLDTVLRFIVRTIFIQTLGREFLGINGLFADILSMLSLTELGFDTAINAKLYKPLADGDEHKVRLYLKFYKRVYRIISAVIMSLGIILIPLLPLLIKDYESLSELNINAVLVYLLYLLQSSSSYLFFAYRSVIVKADQKMYLLTSASYVISIVSSVLQIIVLKTTKNFILYTAVIILIGIITNTVHAIIATKRYPGYFIKEPDSLSKKEIGELMKDCGALLIFKIDSTVLKATDNLVISSMLGIATVGLYTNYQLIYNTIKGILSRFYISIKASTGNYFAKESIENRYLLFETINLVTVILFGTAAVGIVVCANEFLLCWIGVDYVVAQPLPLLVGIELFFAGLKLNLGQTRAISGVFRQMWYRPVIGIIINIVVSVVLAFVLGINGVVIGTIVAAIFANFTMDPILIHKYTFNNEILVSRYYIKNTLYMVVIVATGLLDMHICNYVAVGYGWLSVIIHSTICVVSIPVTMFAIFHKQKEFRYLTEKCLSIVRKK